MIRHSETDTASQIRESWIDGNKGRARVEIYSGEKEAEVTFVDGSETSSCCPGDVADSFPSESALRVGKSAYLVASYLRSMDLAQSRVIKTEEAAGQKRVTLEYNRVEHVQDDSGMPGTDCQIADTVSLDAATFLPLQIISTGACGDGTAATVVTDYERAELLDITTVSGDFWSLDSLAAMAVKSELDAVRALPRSIVWLEPYQELEPFKVEIQSDGTVVFGYRPPSSDEQYALLNVVHWAGTPPKLCGSSAVQIESSVAGRRAVLCDGPSRSLLLWQEDGTVVLLYTNYVLDAQGRDQNAFNNTDTLMRLAGELTPVQ